MGRTDVDKCVSPGVCAPGALRVLFWFFGSADDGRRPRLTSWCRGLAAARLLIAGALVLAALLTIRSWLRHHRRLRRRLPLLH